ncbi:major facilitator superfamily domain-containing protein [Aspergillus navahoensis]
MSEVNHRFIEAQSTFTTSTLVADVEKAQPTIYGSVIDTSCSPTGAVFEAKAQLLNEWFLFIITSVGWFLDSATLFSFPGDKSVYLPVSLSVGLTVGAAAWPWMSDTLGRKWIFTSTIVSWVWELAIGGNQLVDGMILVEMLPASHQFLVATQGAFWGLGQLVSYAVRCDSACHYVTNKGWRYVWWTFGCITLVLYLCRFFPLRDTEATQIVKDIAAYNKRQTWLTEASFARIDSTIDATESRPQQRTKTLVSSLGADRYQATHGVSAVTPSNLATNYLFSRNLHIAICAIPGPIVAALLIGSKGLGRKRTGAIIAMLIGLFHFLATVARSRDAALAFNCIFSFLEYAGLAVLTTYLVEVFPAPVRGPGLAVMGFVWGLFGLIAQIIDLYTGTTAAKGGPVWFCGAIRNVMVGARLVIPLQTRGRAAA